MTAFPKRTSALEALTYARAARAHIFNLLFMTLSACGSIVAVAWTVKYLSSLFQ